MPVPGAELVKEGPRRAVLLANRAQAYLARAAGGGGDLGTWPWTLGTVRADEPEEGKWPWAGSPGLCAAGRDVLGEEGL